MHTKRTWGVAAAALWLVACGTRLPDEAFVDAGTGGGATSGQAATSAGATTGASGGPATVPGGATSGSSSAAGAASAGGTAAGSSAAGPADAGTGAATGAAGPNQASDVGVTENTIRIGTIVAENGVLGDAFKPAATGLRSWVEHVNAQGGIGGRTVELFTCDDREDRARTLECARQLVEQDQVFALVATNTRSLGGAATYLHEQRVPVLGNPINNSFYRFDNFFSIYGAQAPRNNTTVAADGQLVFNTTVARYLRQELGGTRAAVFSYDIAESAQAGDAFQRGLELEGFAVDRYVVSFAAPSFDAPVADMQRNGTTIILDAMDEGANRRLCDAMDRRQFTVAAKVSTIPLMGDSLGANFGDACRPVTYVPGDSLPYTDTSVPFIAAYRDGMARYQRGEELHQWGLEAWAMGQILQDYLVAAGPAPTRQGFMDALNAFDHASPAGIMTPTLQYHGDLAATTVRDCIAVARWDDGAGTWVSAAPFPYCVEDAHQYFSPVAEQGT